MEPTKRWQTRGRHTKRDGGRTSPCAGVTPYVLAYREKQTVCASRYPVMRYPSPAAASIRRSSRAGGAGFAPSTSARVDTRDTLAPAGRVLEPLWGQETQAVWGSPAAGAARGTARASPGGPGSRATHNDGAAGSRRARYAAVMWRSPLCGEDNIRVDSMVIVMWISPHSVRR